MTLTFIEWLERKNQLQELFGLSPNVKGSFSTGSNKPPAGIGPLASKLIANPSLNSLVTNAKNAPTPNVAAQDASKIANKGFNTLAPTLQKKVNIGDLTKVVGTSLGMPPEAMGAPKPTRTGSSMSNSSL